MSWLRIDDNFISHPKVLEASGILGKFGLGRVLTIWIQGLAYASKYATDGRISHDALARFHDDPNVVQVACTLVKVGLWETYNGGYQVHDYLEYNISAAEVERKKAEDRERKRRGLRVDSARNPPGIQTTEAEVFRAESEPRAGARARVPSPSPSPEKKDPPLPPTGGTPADAGDGFDEFYAGYPRKVKRPDALKAWKQQKLTRADLPRLLDSVERWKRTTQWQDPEKIPYPASFLRGEQYNDDPAPSLLPLPRALGPEYRVRNWFAECTHEPPCETEPMHDRRVGIDALKVHSQEARKDEVF